MIVHEPDERACVGKLFQVVQDYEMAGMGKQIRGDRACQIRQPGVVRAPGRDLPRHLEKVDGFWI